MAFLILMQVDSCLRGPEGAASPSAHRNSITDLFSSISISEGLCGAGAGALPQCPSPRGSSFSSISASSDGPTGGERHTPGNDPTAKYFLTVEEDGQSKTKASTGLFLMRTLFLACRGLPSRCFLV